MPKNLELEDIGTRVLGIDPGITGGVAVITEKGEFVTAHRTPSIKLGKGSKRVYDIPGMVKIVETAAAAPENLIAGMEKVWTMPRDGRVGAFNFGMGYGIWQGILAGLGISCTLVTPQRWQASVLAGYPRGPHTKTSAVAACKSLFPRLDLSVKADWGMADAALVAEYVRKERLNPKNLGG